MNRKLILCLGLRRSGTTLLFRAFRRTQQFACFDEPFSSALSALPSEHPKQVWAEFIQRFAVDPNKFRSRYTPIAPVEELSPSLKSTQSDYIRWLFEDHDAVFCDLTRCQFKLAALHQVFPNAIIVHLFRSPENFATSHLVPRRSSPRLRDRIHTFRDQSDFFYRKSRFNNWQIEDILCSNNPLLIDRLKRIQISRHEFCQLPAFGKLMAYWWIAFQEMQSVGTRLLGDRFVSLPFGRFCVEPTEKVNDLIAHVGVVRQHFDVGFIRKESEPYRSNSSEWLRMRERLGISREIYKCKVSR